MDEANVRGIIEERWNGFRDDSTEAGGHSSAAVASGRTGVLWHDATAWWKGHSNEEILKHILNLIQL